MILTDFFATAYGNVNIFLQRVKSGMKMRYQIFKILLLAGIIATAWNCSESAAVQEPASKTTTGGLDIQIPQNIVVSEPSYFYQLGTSYYVIAPTTMTVSNGFGKVIGTFNTSTGAIMSLSGDIIAINLDLSKLPVVAPTKPSKNLIAIDLDM
ncbi:hypothetical protein SAMN05720759_101246 [Fibrobacter sp. UWB12]|nr:hypothetical protein SAMN05720759_101246 [Fibrobacter sp. UWB12]